MKNKRIFPILSVIVFCLSLIVTSLTTGIFTYAATRTLDNIDPSETALITSQDGYLKGYSLGDNDIAVAWTGKATENAETLTLNVPEKIGNYNVVAVANGGFRNCDYGYIVLPDTVKQLGIESFAYCMNLKSFTFPTKIKSIPHSAFLDCRSLETVYYSKEITVIDLWDYNETSREWVTIDPDISYAGTVAQYSFTTAELAELNGGELFLDVSNKTLSVFNKANNVFQLVGDTIVSTGEPDEDVAKTAYFIGDHTEIVQDTINSKVIENGVHVSGITAIGNHAFDSCLSLKQFDFPKNLQEIGQSCFQRCINLTRLYLPAYDPTVQNSLTIGAYAFEGCSKLLWVYFEKNVSSIGSYAFANCADSLIFHYGKDPVDDDDVFSEEIIDSKFATDWRKKLKKDTASSDDIPFENEKTLHVRDNVHPEMVLSLEKGKINLNSRGVSSDEIWLNPNEPDNSEYLVLQSWSEPEYSTRNYYNKVTGELIIPSTVYYRDGEKPLKVIGEGAFLDKTCLTSVTFKDGLVQICKRAFLGCTSITNLSFEGVTTLREIGNNAFNNNAGGKNTAVSSLKLPACLWYVGSYAFYNFTNVNTFSFQTDYDLGETDGNGNYTRAPNHPQLKVLAGYSFSRLGEDKGGVIDLVLPNTLNDAAAIEAKINQREGTGEGDWNDPNFAAIGPYSFGSNGTHNGNSGLRTVIMEKSNDDDTGTTSVAPNAFNRCKRLLRFVSNKKLCFIGNDAFKNCSELKEVYFSVTKIKDLSSDTYPYPWGCSATTTDPKNNAAPVVDNGTIGGKQWRSSPFGNQSGVFADLIIYLNCKEKGSGSDVVLPTVLKNTAWNTESGTQAFPNEFISGNNNGIRTSIPVVYDIDFINTDNYRSAMKYISPGKDDGTVSNKIISAPSTTNDYNGKSGDFVRGTIVLAKNTNDKYVVVKYYYDKSKDAPVEKIDLTGITDISSHITTIGQEAFAYTDNGNNKGKHRGLYFVLPDSVTEIGERAFYRKAPANSAVITNAIRILTYKQSNILQPSQNDFDIAVNSFSENSATNDGYCQLPPSLKRIERNAFYSNLFKTITINSNLDFVGKSAFVCYPYSTNVRSSLTSITISSSGGTTHFNTYSNGIYCTESNIQTLLYQAQGKTGNLSIDTNTVAIGMHACANTSYSSIALNNNLTHIYGGGFQNNMNLQTVTVPSDSKLTYISAYSGSANTEVWKTDNTYFDVVDGVKNENITTQMKNSQGNAFKDCTNLTTFNFKNLGKTTGANAKDGVIKIGTSAFENCSKLQYMSQSADGLTNNSYSYYLNTYDNGSLIETRNDYVLDLSSSISLASIGANAFKGCVKSTNGVYTGIRYIHLPSTGGSIYIGGDGDSSGSIVDAMQIKILVGDTAWQACSNSAAVKNKNSNPTYYSTVAKHYKETCFGARGNTNSNELYYHATSVSDLVKVPGNTFVWYWTEKTVGNNTYYILFKTIDDSHTAADYAEAYFNSLSQLFCVSKNNKMLLHNI